MEKFKTNKLTLIYLTYYIDIFLKKTFFSGLSYFCCARSISLSLCLCTALSRCTVRTVSQAGGPWTFTAASWSFIGPVLQTLCHSHFFLRTISGCNNLHFPVKLFTERLLCIRDFLSGWHSLIPLSPVWNFKWFLALGCFQTWKNLPRSHIYKVEE